MTVSDLAELLERVEAATDFDRALDRAIGFAVDGWELRGDLIYVPGDDT